MILSILFYITFFLFSLGQVGRVSFLDQAVNIYLYEIFFGLSLLILIIKYRLKPFEKYLNKFKSVAVFFIILLISFVFSLSRFNSLQNITALLYLLRLAFYFAGFMYFLYHLGENPSFKTVVKRGLILFIIITFFTSLIQYFFYQDLRNLFYLGWDPHLYRLFGVFLDSYVSAAVYGLIFFWTIFSFKSW